MPQHKNQTSFKKGMTPWNKGKKLGFVPKGAFKKGDVPKFTPEHRRKLSEAQKGKKPTPETLEKLRISHLGQKAWNKGIAMWKNKEHPRGGKGKTAWNKGKKFPQVSGSKSHFWKGGITPINTAIRQSLEYKLWRTAVFTRDKFTCIWCASKEEIQADHIKSFAHHPELRFAIDNGRTLCKICHMTTDTYLKNTKK